MTLHSFQRRCLLFIALAICMISRPAHSQAPADASSLSQTASNDIPSLALQLRSLESNIRESRETPVRLNALRTKLPAAWRVHISEGSYEISPEPLRTLLASAASDPNNRTNRADDAAAWVADLRKQLEGYEARMSAESHASRSKLDEILHRHEFSAVRPPNAWDLLRQRINGWLLRLLKGILDRIVRHPMGVRALFWIVVLGVTAWLALMLFRFWNVRARRDEMQAIESVAAHRSWQEWIRAAREAAARGDFREAVHSAYWAGIVHLEDSGVIESDRTRTPREYLRAVADSSSDLATPPAKLRDSLAALTSRLERVWYGLRPASAEDFQECMHRVQELGCRLP